MKRQVPMILLLLIALLPVRVHDAAQTAHAADNVLRLHILANSDAANDQRVKLLVRDAIRPLFERSETYADARTFLLAHGALLQTTAERVLKENGMDYGVQLSLGTEAFPDRKYGEKLFPAGRYDALIVRLGRGAGQNWWCVLFPPLCIISEDGEAVDLESIELESTLYRWAKEWIERWKNGSEFCETARSD